MSLEGVSKRVEMSLSLTAANEIVAYLSRQPDLDSWTLSKMAILFTVFLVYVDSLWATEISIGRYIEREGVVKLLGITRQISILAVARYVPPPLYPRYLCSDQVLFSSAYPIAWTGASIENTRWT
jgi:hypothetical protein